MPSFDPRPWLGLLLFAGPPANADELTLAGDARLTGDVRSIDGNGVVELVSPLSPDPLKLVPGAVSEVRFSASGTAGSPPGAIVELANGDLLPGTISGLDDKNLSVTTPYSGEVTIPRAVVNSLQFGVRTRRVIYSGPKNLGEWNHDGGGAENWTFSKKSLSANGPARASKNFETPRQFILKFSLEWQRNPNFLIYFADPLEPGSDAVDRYHFQFNGAGMEIKRHSTKGPKTRTVMQLPRTPDKYEANQLEVEIRVDRNASRIQLFLNGEPEGSGVDVMPEPPSGGGVTLANASPNGSPVQVRNIEIAEFDNTRVRHRAEDRGDTRNDSLISRDDDRWGGHLIGIQKRPEGSVFSFKSDFQDEALELLESEVSTLFFAKAGDAPVEQAKPAFVLRLRDEGSLRLSSCVFADDGVTAEHPLLGTLKIGRQGVAAIERAVAEPLDKTGE
ncbi:hypothetical protein JIN84_00780 [Luteolibacter yonseiensis]|uniref:Uncharacterized protein n=1 Tax=Luteolibacter yonseiensis TaxID=1144680 RepID=A0A934R0B9_9BACT|nr:hypothetical protein [Luteolibacter yonseiensis]MBK1814142.1 hypothetical protein [Luteolibacter yonseiensis]